MFEKKKSRGKIVRKIGYLIGFFVFVTILFFILKLLNKLPDSWTYFHVTGIVILIVIVATIFKRLLK